MKETKEIKKEEKKSKTVKPKESKTAKKGKNKEKVTIGDIFFRILILGSIFLIALITYITYLKNICS